MNLSVVTVTWPEDWRYKRMATSFGWNGIIVHNLCSKQGDFVDLSSKVELMRKFLAECKSTHVMFCDGYDVVASPCASVERLLLEFQKFKSPIVFSAEKNCWPDADLSREYDRVADCKSWNKYLNSGLYIGTTKALRMLLKAIDVSSGMRDQREFTAAYLSGAFNMRLDHHCLMFQSMHMYQDDLVFTNNREVLNRLTLLPPLVFHGNGSSDLTAVCNAFNLPTSSQ